MVKAKEMQFQLARKHRLLKPSKREEERQEKKKRKEKMLRICRVEFYYLNKPKKYFMTALIKLGN